MTSEFRTRPRDDTFDWLDPSRLMVEARRHQAETIGRAARLAWDWLGRALRRVAWSARRRRAIAELQGMDTRLLADIGLRRSDIELAVDGHLDDPRFRRRARLGRTVGMPPQPAPSAAGPSIDPDQRLAA